MWATPVACCSCVTWFVSTHNLILTKRSHWCSLIGSVRIRRTLKKKTANKDSCASIVKFFTSTGGRWTWSSGGEERHKKKSIQNTTHHMVSQWLLLKLWALMNSNHRAHSWWISRSMAGSTVLCSMIKSIALCCMWLGNAWELYCYWISYREWTAPNLHLLEPSGGSASRDRVFNMSERARWHESRGFTGQVEPQQAGDWLIRSECND